MNDNFISGNITTTYEQIRLSIVASIPACHAGDPGSIPGVGAYFFHFFASLKLK